MVHFSGFARKMDRPLLLLRERSEREQFRQFRFYVWFQIKFLSVQKHYETFTTSIFLIALHLRKISNLRFQISKCSKWIFLIP
ncbi:MAG: hypothetical protein U5L45_24170 [Saprospiraceae bacterium]|nr:hypothetical protein [Saprospiraceae bacterium]